MRTMPAYDGPLAVNKKVHSVDGSTIHFEGGGKLEVLLDAECCSSSDFEDLGQFKELVGSTIRTVEDRSGKSNDGLLDLNGEYESRAWHFLVFITDKGHVTIDWRNDSNGYYDGTAILEVS